MKAISMGTIGEVSSTSVNRRTLAGRQGSATDTPAQHARRQHARSRAAARTRPRRRCRAGGTAAAQPDQRIQEQRQQGDRPAQEQQHQPHEETEHRQLHLRTGAHIARCLDCSCMDANTQCFCDGRHPGGDKREKNGGERKPPQAGECGQARTVSRTCTATPARSTTSARIDASSDGIEPPARYAKATCTMSPGCTSSGVASGSIM
jgi:hypothetical protein